jgi:hypothetical protein
MAVCRGSEAMSVVRLADRRPSIDFAFDPAIPRLVATVRGAVTGPELAAALGGYYRANPHVVLHDMIYDVSAYCGNVAASDLEPVVEAYLSGNPDLDRPRRLAFITSDPHFQLWAVAMSYQFPGREHRCFPTWQEAEVFLAQPIEERPRYPRAT